VLGNELPLLPALLHSLQAQHPAAEQQQLPEDLVAMQLHAAALARPQVSAADQITQDAAGPHELLLVLLLLLLLLLLLCCCH
jgi:hypothetical protein